MISNFMNYSKLEWWERFQKYYTEFPKLGLAVDLSRMNVDDSFFAAMEPQMQKAFANMAALESGAIANPDENRMVGIIGCEIHRSRHRRKFARKLNILSPESRNSRLKFTRAKFAVLAGRLKITF